MDKHTISIKSPNNPDGDSIVHVISKLDRNFDLLHNFMTNTGVNAGTYSKIVIDEHGRIVSGLKIDGEDVRKALNNNRPVQLSVSGDITGSVVFDTTKQINLNLTLPNIVNPGIYTRVNVDASGRVTDGGALTSDDVVAALKKPETIMVYTRCLGGVSDFNGSITIPHHIADGTHHIVNIFGVYKSENKMLPMIFQSFDDNVIDMTGALPNTPVQITIQYSENWVS